MDFKTQLETYRTQVENALHAIIPPATTRPAILHEAMRYSVFAGGKRLRPVLLLAAHGSRPSSTDPRHAAVAIECLHTYSLIHDDLPCMDDSPLRRGVPTCHSQFGEATALLAGDALLTYALWLLADAYAEDSVLATALVRDLGDAAGSTRLIGGQQEDLLGEQEAPTPDRLTFIHENKTSALITTCLTMGTRLSGAPAESVAAMTRAGRHLGLAFQIIDDILDVTSSAEAMGKPVGADADHNKMTYPALYGLDASREKAREHTSLAEQACAEAGGDTTFLIALMQHMLKRVN